MAYRRHPKQQIWFEHISYIRKEGVRLRYLQATILAAMICSGGSAVYAGGLSEPIVEAPVAPPPGTPAATPQAPIDPPQGSVNGGYLLLGAFAAMAAAAASN